MNSKKELEVILSKLKQIDLPKVELEQYFTPSNIAAEVLWLAFMNGDIRDKIVADLGCGNGILGIGAALLGAKRIIFLDADHSSIMAAKHNFKNFKLKNALFLNKDITHFNNKVDTVIQNPPFGVQNEHADRIFLIKAMKLSDIVYSFHKLESRKFIEALARDYDFRLNSLLKFKFEIKKTQKFHTKKVYSVNVGCFILRKI